MPFGRVGSGGPSGVEQYGVQVHDPDPGPGPAQGASSAPPLCTAAVEAAEPTEPEAGP